MIFYRGNQLGGKVIPFNITQNGIQFGQLAPGTEIVRQLDPGGYTFVVSTPSLDGTDQLTLNVQAGMTYRIEGKILMSWPMGRPKFGSVQESGTPTRTIAPESAPAVAAPASQPASANIDAAVLGLRAFRGDWQMDMWSLTADGNKQYAQGSVSGVQDDKNSVSLTVNEISMPGVECAIGTGQVTISVHPQAGLTLTSKLPASGTDLNFAGRFRNGRYVFYLIGGSGNTMTGVDRSSMRLEFATEGVGVWVAESYVTVDGQTFLIQSARFTRPL